MRDALSNYLSLANGITEVTRQRAVAAARALVSSGEATAEQIGTLAEDLVETSRGNREVVTSLVRFETDRALGRLGLATNEEVSALTRRIQVLEASVRQLTAAAVPPAPERPAAARPAKRPAATTTSPTTTAKAAAATASSPRAAASKPSSGTASATRTTGATRTAPTRAATGTGAAKSTGAATSAGTAKRTAGSGAARAPRRTTGPAARS